jgi:hypothetical protein
VRIENTALHEQWPIALTAHYVRSLAAVKSEEENFEVDVAVGRSNGPGDLQLRYGFAVAEESQGDAPTSVRLRVNLMVAY